LDSPSGRCVASIQRGGAGQLPAATEGSYFPDDVWVLRDSASTSFVSGVQSPGSISDNQPECGWDVTFQTRTVLGVTSEQASASEFQTEAGVFRWPKEAAMSPCSVATEVPEKTPHLCGEMTLENSSCTDCGLDAPTPPTNEEPIGSESGWDLTLQVGMVLEFTPGLTSACEVQPETARKSFRWPQEAAMSPCSVATEIPSLPATPAQV